MEWLKANNFPELLGILKVSRRRGTSEFSYHQLALRLGFSSARSLAMAHKGQRPPSAALVRSVCEFLQVTPREREFVHWLAERSALLKKGKATAGVDEKIARFKAIHVAQIRVDGALPGVVIEISATAPEGVRRRLEEVLRELLFEISNPDFKPGCVSKPN